MARSDRSRSPADRGSFEETERLREAYRKIRTAKRGGKIHKRRLKSICARLLEHLIRLIDLVLQEFSVGNRGQGDPSASYYRNRRQQAADRLGEVRQGWLPRRDQYILEFSQYEELESELAFRTRKKLQSRKEFGVKKLRLLRVAGIVNLQGFLNSLLIHHQGSLIASEELQ